MYLLDTNVVSELRRVWKGNADPHVTLWVSNTPGHTLFLSVISILELEVGRLQKARVDTIQGEMLRIWIETGVLRAFSGRILPVDTDVAVRCAALHVPDLRSERDALIAATGLVYGFTVVTRNVADFARTGVTLVNPWEA
jgi:toxin FitB